MRGEHKSIAFNLSLFEGSSPHARGALVVLGVEAAHLGIIPACAGSTQRDWQVPVLVRDHPRMRGEHLTVSASMTETVGSSPHARGAPGRLGACLRADGIIPACAGSTGARMPRVLACRDHPRMRGEHENEKIEDTPFRGSSPHARGAPQDRLRAVADLGIIPACAGST